MNKIIEVNHLSKSYGEVKAVKDISFYVEKGKLFSFLGPNGAGKSTTIDTLCTLTSFDRGEIVVNGHKLGRQDTEIRKSIGIVFQDSVLDERLTIRENLMVRAGFYAKDRNEKNRAVRDAAGSVELLDIMDRPYGKLSGGQRRRADIARALLHKPEILFLDEPTTGLDPQTRQSVWQAVRKLQVEREMTIFLTTHYMEEAAQSDYIIVIDHGEIAAKGTPDSLKSQFASDYLSMTSNQPDMLERALQDIGCDSARWHEGIRVNVENTMDALPILKACGSLYTSFEVIKGSMDDVFIGITGKEIRG